MRIWIVFLVLAVQAVLPLLVLAYLWFRSSKRRLDWLLRVLVAGSLFLDLILAGRWDWLGYGWRFVLAALLVPALVRSSRRVRPLPWISWMSWPAWLKNAAAILLFLYFSLNAARALAGQSSPPRNGIDLAFPLHQGTYYVGQGGASAVVNYHSVVPQQRFALDITRLNRFGLRARGLYPRELSRYEIFGTVLHAPCAGQVLRVESGLEDLQPPETDPNHPPGNHVLLECGSARVMLAHMRKGSINVQEGQQVASGEAIGRVGNSGNTSEPHLHIHAEDASGIGIPITFGGRFLTRNSLYRAD